MLLGSCLGKLCLCDWQEASHRMSIDGRLCRALKARYVEGISPVIENAIAQLDEYFMGHRTNFDLPFMMVGTDFQKSVWTVLESIPYGSTTTYAAVARSVGRPKAVRAVANAIGANPMSIIVPCHRVVGNDMSMTGYAGGITVKHQLLELESPSLFSPLRVK